MYATVTQANAFASAYYSSSNGVRLAWEALSDEDKQVMLNKAEQVIDQLPFQGCDVVIGKAFPREPNQTLSLLRAQDATIELALQLNGDNETQMRIRLQNQGVKSYKIGDISETFGSAKVDNAVSSFAYGVVYPILKDWIGGGYNICPTHHKK